jgi:hypothetical protein
MSWRDGFAERNFWNTRSLFGARGIIQPLGAQSIFKPSALTTGDQRTMSAANREGSRSTSTKGSPSRE